MKSLQRLQQQQLASDPTFTGFSLTPKAQRLQVAFRKGVLVGAISTTTLLGAAAYVKVGPGSYDPAKLYVGDPSDSRVKASIFDRHRSLLSAQEYVRYIRQEILEGESNDVRALAERLAQAKQEEQRIKTEFALQTKGLSDEQIQDIVGDDERVAPEASIAQRPSRPRM